MHNIYSEQPLAGASLRLRDNSGAIVRIYKLGLGAGKTRADYKRKKTTTHARI